MNVYNPYNYNNDLLVKEKKINVKCPYCNYFNVYNFVIVKDFDYEEWKTLTKFETKNSKDYIKLRINDAIDISKNMNIHPTRVFNQLNSSYWAAFDWDVCEQLAINDLKIKCKNCKIEYNELLEKLIKKENNE